MSTVDNPNSVMYVPPVLRAARRLVFQTGIKALPQSIPLEQIAIIEMGQSPEGNSCSNTPDGVPLLNGPTEFGDIHPIPVQWTSDPRKFAETGDLLFCVRGATAGRTNWADQPYAIGRGLCAIRGKQHRGDTYFIYHMLRDRRDALADQAHGSTFMNLSKQELHQLAIPQMTVEMQHALGDFLSSVEQSSTDYEYWHNVFVDTPFADTVRIVARIEALAGRVAEAQRLRAEAITEVENIWGTKAQELFSEQTWHVHTVDSLCDVRGGIQKSVNRTPRSNPRRYLTVAHVQRNWIDISDPRYFEVSDEELERWRLWPGDILVIEGNGSAEQIGRTALFSGEIEDCVHQNHVIRVRPNQDKILPKYLNAYLNNPTGKEQMVERSRTTSGLFNLSVGRIKTIEVPLAPMAEQKRIIDYLDNLNSKLAELHDYQSATQAKLDALLPAILDKAFRGKF